MARYFGKVIYGITKQDPDNEYKWDTDYEERTYMGNVIRDITRISDGVSVNDNIAVNNQISIVADAFAFDNCQNIEAIEWLGQYWKVTSMEIKRPRLILYFGGVWNGYKSKTTG